MRKLIYLIIIFASLCAIIFLIRYILLRRKIHTLIDQLTKHANQKVHMTSSDRQVEELAILINEQIEKQKEKHAEKLRIERELKAAIASMSHDLRTPLTAIIGYLELLEKHHVSTDEQYEQYLTILKKRTAHLQSLINNFFALSTVDADDYPLHVEKIHLNSLLKEVLMSYYDQFQEGNKEPIVKMSDQRIAIFTDLHALKRVIENLMLNALQHATKEVYIELKQSSEKALLTIRNKHEHPGIERIDPEMLFERFYTIDQTRQEHRGLGLSIVKSLMEKMNGDISVLIDDEQFNITCRWPIAKNL